MLSDIAFYYLYLFFSFFSISFARVISLLVIALTSNDFRESLTVFQLIVIIDDGQVSAIFATFRIKSAIIILPLCWNCPHVLYRPGFGKMVLKEICTYLLEFDLIIMDSHRITSTLKSIGSTTRKIMDTLRKPVLLIHE